MAGHFSSRVFSKCPRHCGSIISRNRNVSSPISNGNFQRKIHASSQRRLPMLNCQSITSNGFSVTVPHGKLLIRVQTSGLHMTCAASSVTTTGSDISAEGPIQSNLGISEQLPNDINSITDTAMSSTFDTAQDIFASGVVGEQSLSSLGLGGYTPIGIIQHALDFAHINLGLPWWGAIVCGTILFRILVFPLMIKGQVNAAKLNIIKPELERLQEKMREVSNLQNPMQQAAVSMELQDLFKKNDCHPIKSVISPLIQLPLFVSFFIGIRRMSYLPIESMRTGGIFWFTDLTSADPYFILPLFCAGTMLLTIETGADVGMGNPNMKMMKNVFRGMCVMMVPLTYTFPTAIFTYWITSNFMSLAQVLLLKQADVKKYFGLPEVIIPPADPNVKSGGFIENMKAGYKNAQEAASIKNTQKMKERNYKSSMKDVYQETFEYNPKLKQNQELFDQAKNPRNK